MSNYSYISFVLERLSPLGGIAARAMFGGHGIYKDGVFFALIADGELFFRVDDASRPEYEREGSHAFTYEMKGKEMRMATYYSVPDAVLEDDAMLVEWVERACRAAYTGSKKRKKPLRA